MNNLLPVALVTGGVRGIGAAIVQALVLRGDKVFIFDCLPVDHPEVLVLKELGVGYCVVNVADGASVQAGFAVLDSWLHNNNFFLQTLINNAGITRDGLAIRMKQQDWDDVIAVNLTGSYACSQQAIKRMLKNQVSYLISISSIVGRIGNPGQVNYAASKAGVNAMTKSLAAEYAGKNILVNAIAPGFIQTAMTAALSESVQQKIKEMIPLKRFGSVQDIAQMVLFLTSGRADYLTGQIIEISGGMF